MAKKQIVRIGIFAATITLLIGAFTVSHAWFGKLNKSEEVASDAIELNWEDMVPEGFTPPENPIADMTREEIDKLFDGSEESNKQLEELEAAMSYAPVVDDLDGKRIKIPGYVVPLDFDGQTELSEFLLVPYYGACIHTPPPPANQVVHANLQSPITLENTYDPVFAIGVIRTKTTTSNLAEAGYTLELEQVVPYEPQ